MTLADYYYVTGSGKHRHTHNLTICVGEDQELEVPQFFMRPEVALFDWIGEKLGGQDVDFTEDPAFSGKWVLQGPAEKPIRELFTRELRGFMVQRGQQLASVEGQGHVLLLFRREGRVKPDRHALLIGPLLEMVGLITHRKRDWHPPRGRGPRPV